MTKRFCECQNQNHQIFYRKSNQSIAKTGKNLKIVDFRNIFFQLNIRSRQLCYGCTETIVKTLILTIGFQHKLLL